jgi:4-carboxymuconolactone decarboxylase
MNAPSLLSNKTFPEHGLAERLSPPVQLDPAQQEAADELINGPRRGVYGPFRPLLHRPPLLRAVAKLGETLRYDGTLEAALREWTICVVAHESLNVFEWDMHVPLAQAAGVPAAALAALAAGEALPSNVRADLVIACDLAHEIVTADRITDQTYAKAVQQWGEAGLVEVITLVGYFTMVCWLMNVARTPGPETRG